jgi:hypothetical protein
VDAEQVSMSFITWLTHIEATKRYGEIDIFKNFITRSIPW